MHDIRQQFVEYGRHDNNFIKTILDLTIDDFAMQEKLGMQYCPMISLWIDANEVLTPHNKWFLARMIRDYGLREVEILILAEAQKLNNAVDGYF